MSDKNKAVRRRTPLNRERVLRGAIAVADSGGLESLTMRRVGQHLGVEAMSLYKHVANKDEILDGIVDLVISEIALPASPDWKTAMRERATSARQVLGRHPWAVGMMESRETMGPASLRYADAVIGSLRTAGFSIDIAARAFLMLDSYIYGFVVQESSYSTGVSDETTDTVSPEAANEEYPHLAEMARAAARPGNDYADAFTFGLDLILESLDGLRD